jgi:membrane complex biogenesis BtpA family protein
MLHAPALPASPLCGHTPADIRTAVLRDAEAWVTGGVRFLMLENFGDTPFFPGAVPATTVSHLAVLARDVVSEFPDVSLGINVLRNDGCSALAVAHAANGQFIRVNVLCGARLTDQGIVEGIAHELMRLRAELKADHIAVLADVDVKHSAPLAARPLESEVSDLIRRGHADALIVSGDGTGLPVDVEHLRRVAEAADDTPVFVGSGVNADNAAELAQSASGLIVGTAAKQEGNVLAPVEVERVRRIVAATHQ